MRFCAGVPLYPHPARHVVPTKQWPSMPDSPVSPSNAVTEYLADRQCARQWRDFLRALAAEFSANLPAAELRSLLHRVGTRFAAESPLPALRTLDDVQAALSRIWLAQDWGWVTLAQHPDHVAIHHHAPPLSAAFGVGGDAWAGAFLEGAYQQWFEQQGAPGLQVVQTTPPGAWGSLEFRLGR